ncbi:MAG: DUF5011 domain-containing protein [Candidatus Izemoplasmatales bacterium]
MRKAALAFVIAVVLFGLAACDPITTATTTATTAPTTVTTTTTEHVDQAPTIAGIDDVTIEKNAGFAPLAGVTATDPEDGDISDDVRYTGNVNPNAVGVYTLTYTVTDSYGNVTTEQRVVTVVLTDTQAPILAGIGAITIYVGESFDPEDGVSAIDTIDGEVDFSVDGTVDVWTPGEYTLAYAAEDAAGNEAEQNRVVTVTYGDFVFGEPTLVDDSAFTANGELLTYAPVAGGVINAGIAPFTYVKVTFTGSAATAGSVGIELGTLVGSIAEIAVGTTSGSAEAVYVLLAPLTDATLTIDTNGLVLDFSVEIAFAEIRDLVAPVLNLPSDEIGYPVNYPLADLEALLRANVTAVDDIDGNVTASVTVDLGDLDLATVGLYTVVYAVVDAGGNETTLERTVVIGNQVDSGILTDPTFQNQGDGLWNEKSNNGDADISYNATEGTMDVLINSLGGWASAAGAYYKESSLVMEADVWYQFTFTVRTSEARKMMFRMGMALGGSPWYDDFDGNSNGHILNLTTDWQTFSFYFKLDDLVGSDGSELFGIELNLGWVNYENAGIGGTTSFKDVYLYKITTSFEAPTITRNYGPTLPTKLTVGDPLPNFADYVVAMDMSRNVLTPTIDSAAVNMNAEGSYDVVYSVTDDHDMTTTYTITFQVFSEANADVVGPVVTIKDGVPTSVDQFTNLSVDLTQLVDVVDAVDGILAVDASMVDDGGLNFAVAGVYTVTYTVYDQSGNVTVFTQDVTVVDKQGPAITIGDFTINFGDAFDPFVGLSVVDNVDGSIAVGNVTVDGLDQFMVDGFAAVEGTFDITYTVSDALGNVGTKTVSVTVTAIIWDTENAQDLLADGVRDEGPTHSSVAYDAVEGAVAITAIDPNTDSWDRARWVYYFNAGTEIIAGQTYRFAITVKATVATELHFRVGATLWVDPWIDDFDGGLTTVLIGTDYVTYQVVFTADKSMVNGNAKFQFMYGYLPTDAGNTIYVKEFLLMGEAQPEYTHVTDLVVDNAFTGSAGNGITIGSDAGEGAATITNIPAYTYDWMTGRLTYFFDQSVLEYGKEYRFAITMKATTATKVRFWIGTALFVEPWLDTFSDCKTDVMITDAYATYYVYFTVDKASFDAESAQAKFEFSIGYLNDAANTLYVKDFAIESVKRPHLFDGYVIEAFDYTDEAAFEAVWTHRYGLNGGANTDYASDDYLVYDAEYEAMHFILHDPVNEGWDLAKVYGLGLNDFGVTNEYKYLSFYITNNTTASTMKVWLHIGDSKNAYDMTLPAPGTTGWATINVNVHGAASLISEFAIGFNNWSSNPVHGSFVVYEIVVVKDVAELDYLEIETIPNDAPVVAISDASLALLSGMTLKAGESVESLLSGLLSMISITDTEDGVIAATADMIGLGGLDPANPVMGSYTLTVVCQDSQGTASNTLSIPLSIVTVLDDFEAYADDAAFKTAWTTKLYGFRSQPVAGTTWAVANGALIADGENNVLQLSYSYAVNGMNGIRINITKAELVAAGATYVGIFVKTSNALAGTNYVQCYKYTAGGANAEILRYDVPANITTGFYIYISVSSLSDDTASIGLMLNIATGNTGIMTFDNFVIK